VCVCVCVLGRTAGLSKRKNISRSQSLLIFLRLASKIKKLNRDMTSRGETSVVPCQEEIQKVEEGERDNDRLTKVDADTKCVCLSVRM
jgi:hypothetical protein